MIGERKKWFGWADCVAYTLAREIVRVLIVGSEKRCLCSAVTHESLTHESLTLIARGRETGKRV